METQVRDCVLLEKEIKVPWLAGWEDTPPSLMQTQDNRNRTSDNYIYPDNSKRMDAKLINSHFKGDS